MKYLVLAAALVAAALMAEEKPAPKPITPTEGLDLANLDAARERAAALYFRKLEENRIRLADAQRQLDDEAKRLQVEAEKAQGEYTSAVDAAKKAAGAEACTLEKNSRWNCEKPSKQTPNQ